MSDEKRKVLEMLEEGKITQEDAERLLVALGEGTPAEAGGEEEPRQEPESGESNENVVINIGGEDGNHLRIDVDGNNVPKLTLYPEGDDALGDEISKTVEDTIEQAQKELGNDWNAIGERINDAVTSKMNSVFGGMTGAPAEETAVTSELTEPGTPYEWNVGNDELNSLSIDWVAGQVEIKQGGGNQVVVTEYSKRPLKEDERMAVTFENGEMHIRFAEKKKNGGFHTWFMPNMGKKLVVELPLDQGGLERVKVDTASAGVSMAQIAASLDELKVHTASGVVSLRQVTSDAVSLHTASGSIRAEDVTGDSVSLESASGSIWAGNIQGDCLKAETMSGSVSLENVTMDDLKASTVSGGLKVQGFIADVASLQTVSGSLWAGASGAVDSIHAETVSGGLELHLAGESDQVKMNTVSGRIRLFLPETIGGFTVGYNTRSGRFTSDFPLSGNLGGKSGSGSYKDGDAAISMNTMSGSMELHRA